MIFKRLLFVPLLLLLSSFAPRFQPAAAAQGAVTRATLANGMRVVIIQNSLAPVVTLQTNFLVGGDETPPGFPGMAHAEEHMAFRGCVGMTADQTAAIYALLGAEDNADTQQNITQYFTTVPAADLDVALQAQAACMRGVDDTDAGMGPRAGRDRAGSGPRPLQSNLQVQERLNQDMFAGTPYAHDPLGTKSSFDATTGAMLQDFYKKWYTPSNAIMVIVGDVDPASDARPDPATLRRYPPSRIAAASGHRSQAGQDAKALRSIATFPTFSALSPTGCREPSSPDYAAMQILADVLGSQRGDLYAMVPAGKALAAEFGLAANYPKASVGLWTGRSSRRFQSDGGDQRDAADPGRLCPEGRAGRPGRSSKTQRDRLGGVQPQLHSRSGGCVVGRARGRRA